MNNVAHSDVIRFSHADVRKEFPQAFEHLVRISEQVKKNGISAEIVGLLQLRVSQLNQCVYCTHLHISELRKLQVNEEKIDLVAVWREATIFSEREKAALLWAEQLAYLAVTHDKDAALQNLCKYFDQKEVVNLTMAIAIINSLNRLAGALNFPMND